MTATYGMVGKMTTTPENRDALLDILGRASALMSARDDCHLYAVSKDADDERVVWVMELWDSKAAHDDALTLPEVRALITEAMPLLAGQPEGSTLIPVAGA